jgi:uncharacterized membrane protein required for colicin V production
MVPFLIVDIVIVLFLAFFAWRGAKKGLILTLFGMLGLIVAFIGARFVSNTFYKPVADIIEPALYQKVESLEESILKGGDYDIDLSLDDSIDALVDVLRDRGTFPGLVKLLDTAGATDSIPNDNAFSAKETLSTYLAELAARVALFLIFFLGILLVWFLVSHILDLAFKLPILNIINVLGGLIIGLAKAIAIVFVVVWACQLVDILPVEPQTPVLRLFTPEGISQLLNRLVV